MDCMSYPFLGQFLNPHRLALHCMLIYKEQRYIDIWKVKYYPFLRQENGKIICDNSQQAAVWLQQ